MSITDFLLRIGYFLIAFILMAVPLTCFLDKFSRTIVSVFLLWYHYYIDVKCRTLIHDGSVTEF